MRAEVLVVWVSFTLCCALVRAREDVQEDAVSRVLAPVKQPRGAVERGRQVEEGGVQMSDEPTEVVAEKAKPKKKKTPEEIEAGRQQLLKDGLLLRCDKHRRRFYCQQPFNVFSTIQQHEFLPFLAFLLLAFKQSLQPRR